MKDAIHSYFQASLGDDGPAAARIKLRVGRTSLCHWIGVPGDVFAGRGLDNEARCRTAASAEIARESLTIGGWVAMWRPMEIFLYSWWPILRERRTF